MFRDRVVAGRPRRAVLFIFLYSIFLFHISGYIGNSMGTTTLSVTMAIVEEGRLTIDSYIEGARELAYYDGHFYSGMPPGQSFIAVPLYFVLRPAISVAADAIRPHIERIDAAASYSLQRDFAVRRLLLLIIFTVLFSAPCAAATSVMVMDTAHAFGERVGIFGALLLPLCTLWWTYGTDYGPRIMGGFLLMLPIWWGYVRRDTASDRERQVMAMVMGGGLTLAPLIRYELVFPAALIGLWLVFQLTSRRAILAAVAAIAVALPAMAYHNHCYGGPTEVAYSRKIWPMDALPQKQRAKLDELSRVEYESKQWVLVDQKEFLAFTPRVVAEGLWDHREALLRFSPFLLLMPVGATLLLRRRRSRSPAILLLAVFALSLFVLALMPHPGFRGAIGSRYMLWSLPALVLLTLSAWNRLPGAARWGLFAISFAPSYLAAMLGSHADGAWTFGQLSEFGLTNYTLSRAQQAGLISSPAVSTIVVFVFWALVTLIFLRPGSRWYIVEPTGVRKVAPHINEIVAATDVDEETCG